MKESDFPTQQGTFLKARITFWRISTRGGYLFSTSEGEDERR